MYLTSEPQNDNDFGGYIHFPGLANLGLSKEIDINKCYLTSSAAVEIYQTCRFSQLVGMFPFKGKNKNKAFSKAVDKIDNFKNVLQF